MYCEVTSSPSHVTTRALPSSTSYPSPPTISARGRGVPNPPNSSGQARVTPSRSAFEGICPADVPLYLHSTPPRQALARIDSCPERPSIESVLISPPSVYITPQRTLDYVAL